MKTHILRCKKYIFMIKIHTLTFLTHFPIVAYWKNKLILVFNEKTQLLILIEVHIISLLFIN